MLRCSLLQPIINYAQSDVQYIVIGNKIEKWVSIFLIPHLCEIFWSDWRWLVAFNDYQHLSVKTKLTNNWLTNCYHLKRTYIYYLYSWLFWLILPSILFPAEITYKHSPPFQGLHYLLQLTSLTANIYASCLPGFMYVNGNVQAILKIMDIHFIQDPPGDFHQKKKKKKKQVLAQQQNLVPRQ